MTIFGKIKTMKKIITLLLLVLMISPTINAQTKKELRKIKKLDLKITVRDIDLNKKFVVCEINGDSKSNFESSWNVGLFSNGLEVGDYYSKKTVKDTENREMDVQNTRTIRGDYFIEIVSGKYIIIKEVATNFTIVGTITSRYNINPFDQYVIDYIIKELIKKVNSI